MDNKQKNKPQSLVVQNRRKMISSVFHLQNKDEEEKYLSKIVIKDVKQTGILSLHGKHLSTVPNRLFSMYDVSNDNDVNVDFNRASKEDDELWWNFKPLSQLDLSSNILTTIPTQIGMFQDLTVLNLQDNALTSLPTEIFQLTKLTKLILNRNKINQLPKHIDKLRDLRLLSISHNSLEQVPDTLVDLVMLEKLDLSYNSITSIPLGIGFLVRLREFDISHNKLTNLPPDMVNLRGLVKMDLNHNNISHLPEAMGEMRKLQILYAQHNNIKQIPDFSGCESIQEIYLGNNFIREIPDDLCEYLQHLKIWDLRDNQINALPQEIVKMSQLIKLDLTNNELTEVPAAISLLPHLQALKLEGNKLKQIRADIVQAGSQRILHFLREKVSEDDMKIVGYDISKMPADFCVFPDKYKMRNGNILNLTMKNLSEIPLLVFEEAKEARVSVVDICKNKLQEFPLGLKILSEFLTELNLSKNQLKQLPDEVGCLIKLKFLDLSGNMLSDLPKTMISLTNMRELALFNNKFTKVPECVFGMVGLEILMLNDNGLTEIDIEGFKRLVRLATLNLSNNNIRFVPPELGTMTQLKWLELQGNSFRQPRYAILEQGTESILTYLRDKIVMH